jgi:branched-chain amino acid transport system ATP-binding protein
MSFLVDSASKRFGKFQALKDVSFKVSDGQILGIAGPNGAGKSTLLNVCTGVLQPSSGTISLDDHRTDKLPLRQMSKIGIARTFQIPQVFDSVDVETNIRIGSMFGRADGSVQDTDNVERVISLLDLQSVRYRQAGQADLLTRKMTMLAAALATKPKIIFMDEPFGGLNSDEIESYVDLVVRLNSKLGLTFVIVEHKMRALTQLSDRLLILNFGEVLCEGPPEEVMAHKEVNEAYLSRGNGLAVH